MGQMDNATIDTLTQIAQATMAEQVVIKGLAPTDWIEQDGRDQARWETMSAEEKQAEVLRGCAERKAQKPEKKLVCRFNYGQPFVFTAQGKDWLYKTQLTKYNIANLERGGLVNLRGIGHVWLSESPLDPNVELTDEICKRFAAKTAHEYLPQPATVAAAA